MRTIRIGAGAGFSGDRIEPAVELADKGELDYLVFECLAERTIALAQQERRREPTRGFDPLLAARMEAVLPLCAAKGVRIITNMGAANPDAAARTVRAIAQRLGLRGLKVAAVTGDDVLEAVLADAQLSLAEDGRNVVDLGRRLISANAYLGAEPIISALRAGADIVICGRAADPAMFLAPLIHEFGWAMDDWTRLGRGTVAGHLLECAGQITGGYFADPGYRSAPDLARLGFPIGEVNADGDVLITKVAGSGGRVSAATCAEQLLYEVHDPSHYLQPDVIADFSNVGLEEVGPDQVRVYGGDGAPKTGLLKVSIGYLDGFVGEGQITYAGPGAVARGRLAIEIVKERLRLFGPSYDELRGELIGVDSVLARAPDPHIGEPHEARLRVAARARSWDDAERVGREVEALYLNGPAGGGGVTRSTREIVAIGSTLIEDGLIRPGFELLES
ncbi:MAG: DUF1446 domain-containing protein [Neomegalonema sp.]|nr:DUF1446 domain-containing protein [Neomegalonema sp.]